jgi:Pyridoxamine 5'-phosphate oxidase
VAEALAFVAAHPHVFLLALRPDGYPTGYAMMARVRDGFVDFSTYGSSAKVKNLVRDGVAALVALSDEHNLAASMLYATGPITALPGASWTETTDVTASSDSGHFTAHVPARITEEVRERHQSGKRIVLRMSIETARFSPTPAGDR